MKTSNCHLRFDIDEVIFRKYLFFDVMTSRCTNKDHSKQFKVINMNKQLTVEKQTKLKVSRFIETPSWHTFCQTEVAGSRISRTRGQFFFHLFNIQNIWLNRTQITTICAIHCILHMFTENIWLFSYKGYTKQFGEKRLLTSIKVYKIYV